MSFPSTWLIQFLFFIIYSDISIKFPKRNLAEITKQVLEVDPELSPDKVDKAFEVKDSTMIAYLIF